jgi:hypothetical protein
MSTTMPTATPTTKPTASANHEITITLVGNGAFPPLPMPPMLVGETVRYSSSSGEVKIVFPERSPFRTDNVVGTDVPGGVILNLVSDSGAGTLPCRCFITLPNGTTVGWSESSPGSGGNHKVTEP